MAEQYGLCVAGYGEPPLGTRLAAYLFLQSLQNAFISLVTGFEVEVIWDLAKLHPEKQMTRMCHLGHMRTPFINGCFSQCLFLNTAL